MTPDATPDLTSDRPANAQPDNPIADERTNATCIHNPYEYFEFNVLLRSYVVKSAQLR